jgi:hypothetical protein
VRGLLCIHEFFSRGSRFSIFRLEDNWYVGTHESSITPSLVFQSNRLLTILFFFPVCDHEAWSLLGWLLFLGARRGGRSIPFYRLQPCTGMTRDRNPPAQSSNTSWDDCVPANTCSGNRRSWAATRLRNVLSRLLHFDQWFPPAACDENLQSFPRLYRAPYRREHIRKLQHVTDKSSLYGVYNNDTLQCEQPKSNALYRLARTLATTVDNVALHTDRLSVGMGDWG